MAPPRKTQKMPSMKELQELLKALETEGSLSMGSSDDKDSTALDDLFEDSFFHSILHGDVANETVDIMQSEKIAGDDATLRTTSTSPSETLKYSILTLPKACSWGDDPDVYGSNLLVRPGYAAVLSALISSSLNTTTSSSSSVSSPGQLMFMAVGSSGIGKSSLCYYLVHELFKAGYDVVISDLIFTSAIVDKQYYGCYTPHILKHATIAQALTSPLPSTPKKPTWWICDDKYLPIKGTRCHVFVASSITSADVDVTTIHTKHKLARPVQFHIPKWSWEEIKAGVIAKLANERAHSNDSETVSKLAEVSLSDEQEAELKATYKLVKGNAKKTFAWAITNFSRPPRVRGRHKE